MLGVRIVSFYPNLNKVALLASKRDRGESACKELVTSIKVDFFGKERIGTRSEKVKEKRRKFDCPERLSIAVAVHFGEQLEAL